MSIKDSQLEKIAVKIRHYQRKTSRLDRFKKRMWMLYHEFVRDDVPIRSESLSYFTLFSTMPIIAGLFLLVTAFSNWAPVQNEFQELLGRLLEPLPDEHQDFVLSFIYEFKDAYLEKIYKGGTWIVAVAVMMLLVLAAKVFINLEDLMNRIWAAEKNRKWYARLMNFFLTIIILPFAMFIALSAPGLVEYFGGVEIGVFLKKGLPAVLMVGGLYFLFRYFPNVRVKPKNALRGAFLSAVLFLLSNIALTIYFRFGTQTAYGKIAAVPVVAFYVYIFWIIVMVGAEWSYVLQHESRFLEKAPRNGDDS